MASIKRLRNEIGSACEQMAENEDVIGIYRFGSSVVNQSPKQNEGVEAASTSDVDLLMVVSHKSLEIKSLIDLCLGPHGHIVHHPDFYSPRTNPGEHIEVIVVPFGTSYFSDPLRGILTGLSAFRTGRYCSLYGPVDMEELIRVPRNLSSSDERYRVFQRCIYGISDLQASIWPLLYGNRDRCDIRRLIRFFLMDVIWVMTGEFVYCDEDIAARIGSVLPLGETTELRSIAEHMLVKRYEPITNESVTVRFYGCLLEVRRLLRLLFGERSRTAMDQGLNPVGFRKDGLSTG